MNAHPLANRPKGKSCKLDLYEQILLPLTGKKQVEYLVAVKAGKVVKGQMRQQTSYPDEVNQARLLRNLVHKQSDIYSTELNGSDFTNWRLILS